MQNEQSIGQGGFKVRLARKAISRTELIDAPYLPLLFRRSARSPTHQARASETLAAGLLELTTFWVGGDLGPLGPLRTTVRRRCGVVGAGVREGAGGAGTDSSGSSYTMCDPVWDSYISESRDGLDAEV